MLDNTKETEVFKAIWNENSGYLISNYGRVWSNKSCKFLSQKINKHGYYEVGLMGADGRLHSERVHRLVALAFCNKPNGMTVVNHIDCNKLNNYYENLEWTTVKGNTIHCYKYGNLKKAQQLATDKAKESNTYTIKVYKDNKLYSVFYGKEETAKVLGISPKTIYNCLKYNRISRCGFYFEKCKKVGDA